MRNVGRIRPSDMHVSITFAGRAPALKHLPQCVFTPKHHLRMLASITGGIVLRWPQLTQIPISSTEMTVTSIKPTTVEPSISKISAQGYTASGQRMWFHLRRLLDVILPLLGSGSPCMRFANVFVITPPLAGIWKISHSFSAKHSSVTDGFRWSTTCLDAPPGGDEQRNMTLTLGSSRHPALSRLWPMKVDDGGGRTGPMEPGGISGSWACSETC